MLPIALQGADNAGISMPDHPLHILGIETSCDETAAAVVTLRPPGHKGGCPCAEIHSNVVLSQSDDHAAFGGVVPEIAARAHVEALDCVIAAALKGAGIGVDAMDAIAATSGPGLIGGLIVGVMTGRAMAAATSKPFVAINHLEGHALTARLTDGIDFPYLLLLVSGGHTQILLIRGVGAYERWGSTIDDALGEAFDKTARLLGIGYPGGPQVELRARDGDEARFQLPRPLLRRPTLDFSFAGLKTAVRLAAQAAEPLDKQTIADMCAGFQAAVCEILADRLERAIERFRKTQQIGTEDGGCLKIVIAGGVAANEAIRRRLQKTAEALSARLIAPPLRLCSDNAAMIAWAAAERLHAGIPGSSSLVPRARWPLDEAALPMIGSGAKVKV